MGDHTHTKGELMFSYRYMRMNMKENRLGSTDISPQDIVTTEANPFSNPNEMMSPMNLRVVPTRMSMDMHMLGAMYAPSDRITLMGMINILSKEMDHITFSGMSGDTELGSFRTTTKGFGDANVTALIKVVNAHNQNAHFTLGLSLPTGSINKTDSILTPMGMRPEKRLPYPMQLGSGTYDLIIGGTYAYTSERIGIGTQLRSIIRLGDNDRNYTLGDEHTAQAWLSYLATQRISVSTRISYFKRGNINGQDQDVMLPVQSADPNRQRVKSIGIGFGVNFILPGDRHRLAIEYSLPLTQRMSGPQLKTESNITLGWQFSL
tara:strand:+ start:113 stop:1072 length:960 start_codon:yes stop_codon:yes gene_type:complete